MKFKIRRIIIENEKAKIFDVLLETFENEDIKNFTRACIETIPNYFCKVKEFHSCDIRCVGIEEGSGRNRGTLGALICSYKGFNVNVGSGFSDEQREHYWNNQDKVIGKIISVKYKEETKNKNGGISIQFPVFECVRFDKNEESYN